MIGRADIEGSKSNVTVNTCAVSQGSYTCGLFEGHTGQEGGYEDAPYFGQAGGVIILSL